MPLAKATVVAFGGLAILGSLSRSCSAQGAMTRYEIVAAENAVVVLGRSAIVRDIFTKVMGREGAEAMLSLPPKELGWKIVESDRVVNALAESSHISRPGNSNEFIASINSLRAFRALANSETRPGNLTLLSSSSMQGKQFGIRTVTFESASLRKEVERSLQAKAGVTRSYDLSIEGLKIDPAFKVPIWKSTKSMGSLELGAIKRNDAFAAIAVGCAFIKTCNSRIYAPITKFVASSAPATSPVPGGAAKKE